MQLQHFAGLRRVLLQCSPSSSFSSSSSSSSSSRTISSFNNSFSFIRTFSTGSRLGTLTNFSVQLQSATISKRNRSSSSRSSSSTASSTRTKKNKTIKKGKKKDDEEEEEEEEGNVYNYDDNDDDEEEEEEEDDDDIKIEMEGEDENGSRIGSKKSKSPAKKKKTKNGASKTTVKKDEGKKKETKLSKEKAKNEKLLKKFPDPKRPSKPISDYLLFAKYFRNTPEAQEVKSSISETSRLTATAWKALPSNEKDKYTNQALEARNKYATDIEKYKNSGAEEEWLQKLKGGLANQPPRSGYLLFGARMRVQKGIRRVPDVAHHWGKLSEEEKEKYNQEAAVEYKKWKEMIAKQ